MRLPVILTRVLPLGALNRDLKIIFCSQFIGALGDGMFIYILPLYMRGLQATPADVGSLFSVFTFSAALSIIPGGFLADRFDRKKVIILGWLVWLPVPLMFSVATHWTQLFPVISLYGFLLNGPALGAYIATSCRKDQMTLAYTSVGASWWLGYSLSPGIGGFLSTLIQMRGVFYLAFALYAMATLTLLFMRSQRAEKTNVNKDPAMPNFPYAKRIVLLSVYFAVVFFFLSMIRPLVVQLFQDIFSLDSFLIGMLGSISFFGSAVFSIILGKVGDRYAKMISVSVALLVGGVSFGLLTFINSVYLFPFVSFLNGASYTIWPLMGASVGSIAPEASMGRWISVAQMCATMAASIAPYFGGVVYGASPYIPFYLATVVFPLLALVALAKPFKEATHL